MKILLAAVLFLLSSSVQAQCARINYKISGLVTSASGAPLDGAYVLFSWIELSDFVQQGEMRTDKSGHYSITIYFNPIASYDLVRGHICDRTLKSVVVSVFAAGYTSAIVSEVITGPATRANYALAPGNGA